MLRQSGTERNAQAKRGGADITLNGKPTNLQIRKNMLVRTANGSREMMLRWNRREDPGWATHTSVINQAIERGCTAMLIIDKETGRSYYADMQTLLTYGQKFDFGHGEQIRLALRYWRQEPAAVATTPAPVSRETTEPQPEPQLSLFAEVMQ